MVIRVAYYCFTKKKKKTKHCYEPIANWDIFSYKLINLQVDIKKFYD